MKTMCSPKAILLIMVLFKLIVCCMGHPSTGESNNIGKRRAGSIVYPRARRNMSVVDDYHGTVVRDPYRWLEDPNSAETKAFIQAQNTISGRFFNRSQVKDKIRDKYTSLKDNERFGCHTKHGGRYYFYHNTGLQNHDVLYKQDDLQSQRSVFLDPNLLSDDGTVSVGTTSFNANGSLFAYTVKVRGSDTGTIKAYPLTECPSGGSQRVCNIGKRFNHSLYYHRLEDNQCNDTLAFNMPNEPELSVLALMSHDNQYVVLIIVAGTANLGLYVHKLRNEGNIPLNPVRMITDLKKMHWYITNEGTQFYILTNNGAPYRKIVRIDLNDHSVDKWVTVVAEDSKKGVLDHALHVADKLVLKYTNEARSQLYIRRMDAGAKEHKVPLEVGEISCLTGSQTDSEVFFKLVSFLHPGSVYRLNVMSYQLKLFHEARVAGLNPQNFETNQVFYRSRNNVTVPMFIVHKKNLAKTANHPTLLYAYGAYSSTLKPSYAARSILFLLNFGGVYAQPNIRGGGVYGNKWHKAGRRENKQNGMYDIQFAAKYLINKGYTDSSRLAIEGGSAGATVMAACLNQRPDLFAAGILEKGNLDMLRFTRATYGHYWAKEYGSPANATQFKWLYRYSPLHNIPRKPKGGQYPATLVLTSTADDRVLPFHSLKFTAQLQYTLGRRAKQTNPLLLYVDTNSGHGSGMSTNQQIERVVRKYSFLYEALNVRWINK